MFKDYLELFLNAEFINGNKKKKALIEKSKRKSYDLSIFSERLTTYCCSPEVFKGVYGILPKQEGYELNNSNKGDYIITILSTLTEQEKLEWIFKKTYELVKDMVGLKKILDSETEAYLFGYLVSEQLHDFVTIKDVIKDIKPQKLVRGSVRGGVSCVMLSSGIYKDSKNNLTYKISNTSRGTVQNYVGKNEFIMMIPRSKNYSLKTNLNIWSHELYHIARNSYGLLNRDYYNMSDLLIDYMKISLPILKTLLK